MKRPFVPIVHWYKVEPYERTVFLVCGLDIDDCMAFLESNADPEPGEIDFSAFDEALKRDMPEDHAKGSFCRCGRTHMESDVVCWFPRLPTVSTLVHELLHAVQMILEAAGVDDRNGEAEAYHLGVLTRHFVGEMRRNVRARLGKEAEWET